MNTVEFLLGILIGMQSISYGLFFYYTRKTNANILKLIELHNQDVKEHLEAFLEIQAALVNEWPEEKTSYGQCGCSNKKTPNCS